MKKFLTVLSICLLLALCLVCVGCSAPQGVTVQSVQSDPVSALNSAMEKAGGGFMADETGVIGIILGAFEKGSVGVSADVSDLVGGSCKVDLVSYIDMPAKRMQYDLDLRLPGANPINDIKFYMDPNGMTLHAPQLLGYNDALRLDLDTIGGLFDPDYANTAAGISMIDTLKASMASVFERTPAKAKEMLSDIFTTLGYEVTETTYEGETIVCLTLNITSEKLATLLCDLIEDSAYDADTKAEAKAGLQEAFEEIELSGKIEFHIQKDSGALIDAIATGSFGVANAEDPSAPDAMEFTIGYKASNSEVSIFAELAAIEGGQRGQAGRIELVSKKTSEGSKLTYTTKLDLTMNDVTFHIGSITFDYDKSTSDYALALKIGSFFFSPGATDEDINVTATLSGKLQKTNNRVTLSVESLAIDGAGIDQTMPFDISFFFEKGTVMPDAPTNPKDITTLTDQEISAMEQYLSTLFPNYG